MPTIPRLLIWFEIDTLSLKKIPCSLSGELHCGWAGTFAINCGYHVHTIEKQLAIGQVQLMKGGRPPEDCAAYDTIYEVSRADMELASLNDFTDQVQNWPAHLGAPVVDGDGVTGNYNLEAGRQTGYAWRSNGLVGHERSGE